MKKYLSLIILNLSLNLTFQLHSLFKNLPRYDFKNNFGFTLEIIH